MNNPIIYIPIILLFAIIPIIGWMFRRKEKTIETVSPVSATSTGKAQNMEEYELMGAAFNKVKEIIVKDQSIASGMAEIIDFCKSNYSNLEWEKFTDIGYDKVTDMNKWIEKVILKEPIPEEIDGLWFGLFNPMNEGGEASADIYIAGNTGFDKEDEDGEWACDPIYFPKARYSESKILSEIYKIACGLGEGLEDIAEYPLCLAYGCLITKYLLNKYRKTILPDGSKSIGVAVGFDSGDFLVIGELVENGFKATQG